MRTLKTSEAAGLLNVSPNTLRTWERKFGFPRPVRSPGRHRAYAYAEVMALRGALRRGLSITSAVSAVRDGVGADKDALVTSLDEFNLQGADRAMEASLALRSMDRSVTETLLPALEEVCRRDGTTSTRWAIAQRWGLDWLSRAQRLSPDPHPGPGVLIGDASGELGAARPSISALELFCRRSGVAVLALPIVALGSLAPALDAAAPACVVVAGSVASDELVGSWTYAVHRTIGHCPAALFLRPPRVRGGGARVLPAAPLEAHRAVLELVAEGRRAKPADFGPEANGFAQSD